MFLEHNKSYFQLTGMNTVSERRCVHHSLSSFREITDTEASSVKLQTIAIKPAINDETLETFSRRNNDLFSIKIASLVNDLPENAKLIEGDLIKILKEQPFNK